MNYFIGPLANQSIHFRIFAEFSQLMDPPNFEAQANEMQKMIASMIQISSNLDNHTELHRYFLNLRDSTDSVQNSKELYGNFLRSFIPLFQEIMAKIPVQKKENDSQKVRLLTFEVLHRLPANDVSFFQFTQ